MKELILGGARSGKSRLAEKLALTSGLPVTYIATACAGDEEMRARIAEHQRQRPPNWALIEEPLALTRVLQEQAAADRCLLVDCLTLWLSNLLGTDDPERLRKERCNFLGLLPRLPGHIILVSNETGLGVVPMNALARRFCDEAGWLHQEIAQHCDRVLFTVAGLAQTLKGKPLV